MIIGTEIKIETNRYVRKILKFARLTRSTIYLKGLFYGVGAAIEHEPILAFLDRQSISDVVDIGANKGQFSLLCRRWLPGAQIIAFEPIPKPAEQFHSVFKQDAKVRLIQAAIGPVSVELDMHVSKAVDSSSLLPIGRIQSELFPGTEESHLERVTVAPLDTFVTHEELSNKTFLKIDVQGYELEVLKGCTSLLDRFFAIYVECSFVELYDGQALAHEVIDLLHTRGFYLARIGLMTFDEKGMSVQGDFCFYVAEWTAQSVVS